MKRFGSQIRETLSEAGYTLVERLEHGEVIVADEDGKRELWFEHDDNAGYTLEIEGRGYEFVRSL